MLVLQAICVLPRNTKDRYDAIKKLCCLEKPGEAGWKECLDDGVEMWQHSLFGSLPLSSLPVHPVQDHRKPEEHHECDHQDCPSAELQARRGAVGTGDTCEGEGGREGGGSRTLANSFINLVLNLTPPAISNIQMKNCMVIGIDSYHDSSQKGRSVLGFIASTNATFTR